MWVALADGDGFLLRRAVGFARPPIPAALRLMGGTAAAPAAPGTDVCDQLLTDARMHLPRPLPGAVPWLDTGIEHRTTANSIRPPAHPARWDAGARAQEDLGWWTVPS